MSQFDFATIDPASKSGTALAFDLNSFRDALNSLHSGSARPAYAQAGTLWLDTSASPWIMKLYTGSTDVALLRVTPAGLLQQVALFRDDVQVRKASPAIELQSDAGAVLGRLFSAAAGSTALRVIDPANPANFRDLSLGYAGATLAWAGNRIWHEGNDGPGSGLEADLLDGLHASAFGLLSAANTWAQTQAFIGGFNYMFTATQPYLRGWRSLPDYAAHFGVNLSAETMRLYDNGNAWFPQGGFTSGMLTNFRKVTQAYQAALQGTVYQSPNGAVVTGFWFGSQLTGSQVGCAVNGFYYKYLQGYNAGAGWFTIVEN